MVNVRYAPKWVPVDRLVGETQGQPPWPMMPQEVYEGLQHAREFAAAVRPRDQAAAGAFEGGAVGPARHGPAARLARYADLSECSTLC